MLTVKRLLTIYRWSEIWQMTEEPCISFLKCNSLTAAQSPLNLWDLNVGVWGFFFMWNPAESLTETVDPSLCCFFTVSSNIWKTACLQSFHNIILHLHHVLSGKSFLVFSRKKKKKKNQQFEGCHKVKWWRWMLPVLNICLAQKS